MSSPRQADSTIETLDIKRSLAAVLLLFLSAPGPAEAQQIPHWPERWLAAGVDFGTLKVAYRLTDNCEIDPDFEITEVPNLDVTREEIFESLTGFLANNTRDDVPRHIVVRVLDEVFGEEGLGDRPMSKSEYDAVIAEFDRLGPWPQTRIAFVSSSTYRCSFDVSGELTGVEISDADKDLYRAFDERLSEQGPFFLSWYIEE